MEETSREISGLGDPLNSSSKFTRSSFTMQSLVGVPAEKEVIPEVHELLESTRGAPVILTQVPLFSSTLAR